MRLLSCILLLALVCTATATAETLLAEDDLRVDLIEWEAAPGAATLRLQEEEVMDAKWVTLDELRAMLKGRLKK